MVYIITFQPFPVGMAPTNRIFCYAKGLQANGVTCEVISLAFTKEPSGCYKEIRFTNISVHRSVSKHKISRIFRRLKDVYSGVRYCRKHIKPYDRIIVYSQNILLNLALLLMIRVKGVRLYYELCEIPFYTNSSISRFVRATFLKYIFPLYDGFIVISEALDDLARRYIRPNAGIIKIPILVDQERFLDDGYTDIPEGYKQVPFVFYAGAISEHKDGVISSVKAFLDAIKRLQLDVRFILAGPRSADLEIIQQWATEHGQQEKIVYVGNLPPEAVVGYLKHAVLFVSNKKDNLQNRYGFSTKIGEVLISGVAVVTTDMGELSHYLSDSVSAYLVPLDTPELLSAKILQALSETHERESIAANGKAVALKEFNCIRQGKRLAEFMNIISER